MEAFFRNYRQTFVLSEGYMKRRKPSKFLNQRCQSSSPIQKGQIQQVRPHRGRDWSHLHLQQKRNLQWSERL